MEILINHLPAALKKDTSFQFITENRYFTGADSYTLNITFPLRGCPQNLRIFGNIGRVDVSKERVRYDCEIRDKDFYKFGTITITSVSPEEVKTQFLEGRSEQNFATDFDEIYINELDLGAPDSVSLSNTPSQHWPLNEHRDYVALPWVNNASGNIQNKADYDTQTKTFKWHSDTTALSFQPYLKYIIRKVADAVGYSIDISKLENSPYAYLLICNTLPAAWDMPEFARALPHWSVTEFFEELEKLLNGLFTIDHRSRSISFAFNNEELTHVAPVFIDKVIDSYTTEISADDDKCEYMEAANIKYSDPGHEMWKFADCPWLIDYFRHFKYAVYEGRGGGYTILTGDWVTEYATFKELRDAAYAIKDAGNTFTSGRNDKASNTAKLLYAKDIDTYFTFYTLSYDEEKDRAGISHFILHMCLIPLNNFSERIFKKDNANTIELKIVPAWIDYTDAVYGDLLFLDCGSLDNADDAVMLEGSRGGRAYLQPNPVRVCQNGEKNKSEEFFDKIFVAFYEGYKKTDTPSFLPRPQVDALCLRADFSYSHREGWSLRLKDNSPTSPRQQHYVINTEQKLTSLSSPTPSRMCVRCSLSTGIGTFARR